MSRAQSATFVTYTYQHFALGMSGTETGRLILKDQQIFIHDCLERLYKQSVNDRVHQG